MKNCDPNNDALAGCMKQLARPYFLLDGVSEVPLSRYLGMKVGLPPICICCRRATDGPASGCAEALCFECYELVRVRGSILRTNADPVVHGNFLPDNPTQFDYLHAIRAIASRIGNKQIFDLADAGMNLVDAETGGGCPEATCLASFGYQWITPLGKRAFCWTIKHGCRGMMLVGCTYNEETKTWDGESTCDINAALRKPAAGRVPDVPGLRRRLQHLIANEIDYTIRPSGTC